MKFLKATKSKMQKMTALALSMSMAVAMGVSSLPIVGAVEEAQAADLGISGHWSEPYMQNMYDQNLYAGDSTGNLNPTRDITRAETVALMNRAFGYTETSDAEFSDVTGTEWYARDIDVAYTQGYFSGVSEGASGATSTLTREQAVSLLVRNLNVPEEMNATNHFYDYTTISTWSVGSVNAATDKGYLSGYEDGTFRPKSNITRGEIAKIMTDSLGYIISEPSTQSLGYVLDNVTISSSGVTLINTVIDGDLFITAGTGSGYVMLDNVIVLGEVIITGTGISHAGQSSVQFNNSGVKTLRIAGGADVSKSVSASGYSYIENTIVSADAYIEELNNKNECFINIIVDGEPGIEVDLLGVFNEVWLMGEGNKLALQSGTIEMLVVDEDAIGAALYLNKDTLVDELLLDAGIAVSGQGQVGYAKVNVSGATLEMLPDQLEIRPGITANVAGQDVDSEGAIALSSLPSISRGFPTVDTIGGTTARGVVQANKGGTIQWAVTLEQDGYATIDDLEVIDPLNYKLLFSGSLPIALNEELYVPMTGLEKDTDYIFTVMLIDEKGDTSSVRYENFKTADDTAAGFATGFPIISEISSEFIVVDYVTLRNADIFWAIYTSDMPAPTASDLRNGNLDYAVVSNADEEDKYRGKLEKHTDVMNGLTEVTDYILYIMTADGNNSSAVVTIKFQTIDTTPPVIIDVYTANGTGGSADITTIVNEAAIVHQVTYVEGEEFPRAGVDGVAVALDSEEAQAQVLSGPGATATSTTKEVDALDDNEFSITGLDRSKDYTMYVMAEDKYGNLSSIEVRDIPAFPDFMEGFPAVINVSVDTPFETAVQFDYKTTKESVVYWAILEGHKNSAPSVGELVDSDLLLPPSESLYKGSTTIVGKNIKTTTEVVYDLFEMADYTLYSVVVDNEGQYSAVYETKFTTPDDTKPTLTVDVVGTTTDTITLSVLADEDITFYYAMTYSGLQMLTAPSDYVLDNSSDDWYLLKDLWDNDWVKKRVIGGYNSKAFGSTAITQNVAKTITISKLDLEQAYDIYYVGQDKNGNDNISNINMVTASTLDETPPTVGLTFGTTNESGNPTTSSAMTLTFSEIVQDTAKQTDDQGFSTIVIPLLQSNLSNHLELWYRPTGDPETQITPDANLWKEVTVATMTASSGKTFTQIVIPGNTYDLVSNGDYYFKLIDIEDKSGNEMLYSTQAVNLAFKTEPPLIVLTETSETTNTLHHTFQLTPSNIDVEDGMYFDLLVWASSNITYNIYQWKIDTDGIAAYVQIGTGASANADGFRGMSLAANANDPLTTLGLTELSTSNTSGWYSGKLAFEITSVNGVSDSELWQEDLSVRVYGAMGREDRLSNFATTPDITSSSFAPYIDLITFNYAANLATPDESHIMTMVRAFRDSIPPSYTNEPWIKPGDNYVSLNISSDKIADVYWVAVPRTQNLEGAWKVGTPIIGTVVSEDGSTNASGSLTLDDAMINTIYAANGTFSAYGSISGIEKIELANGAGNFNLMTLLPARIVNGIAAGTEIPFDDPTNTVEFYEATGEDGKDYVGYEYDLFVFLKGTANGTSAVEHFYFRTQKSSPPTLKITEGTFYDDSATFRFETDIIANVSFIAFPASQITNMTITAAIIRGDTAMPYTDKGTVASNILNGVSGVSGYHNYGTINGLESGVEYKLFAVAVGDPSNVDSDVVEFLGTFTAQDKTGPTVAIGGDTGVEGSQSTANFRKYNGTLTLNFSEPLWYMNNGSLDAVTIDLLQAGLEANVVIGDDDPGAASSTMSITLASYTRSTTVNPVTGATAQPVSSITVNYNNASTGSVITFAIDDKAVVLYDANENPGGLLKLRATVGGEWGFSSDGEDEYQPKVSWVANTMNNNPEGTYREGDSMWETGKIGVLAQ
ncbi:MAG: S-layer homology domain-containing protein [Bacillota bacterium]